MKQTILSIVAGAGVLLGAVFSVPGTALAAAEFNTASNDCLTVAVINYDTQEGVDLSDPCEWTDTSVSARQGESINVAVYYHNNGNQTATNTTIRLSPRDTASGSTHTLSGSVSASNASTKSGTVRVTTPPNTTLHASYVWWYPNRTTSNPVKLSSSQISTFFSNGYNIGSIAPGWASQGYVEIGYQVNPASSQVYTCDDDIDNDNDGYIDYPNDPDCSSRTDSENRFDGPVATAPEATTDSATNIDENSATLRGSYVGASGLQTIVWFEYGTTQSLGSSTSQNPAASTSGSFSRTVTGLQKGRTYYFRAVARNSAGTDYGSIRSFTTDEGGQVTYTCDDNIDNDGDGFVDYPEDPDCSSRTDSENRHDGGGTGDEPEVTTRSATNIGENSATLRGDYDANGLSTTVWFQYGTSSSLGSTTSQMSVGTGSSSFSRTITGLDDDRTYYFRAVARNSEGTSYGDIESFRTDSGDAGGDEPECNDGIDNDNDGDEDYPEDEGCSDRDDDSEDSENDDDDNDLSIVTRPADHISQNAAILNADYETDRDAEIWFQYGETTSMNETTARTDVDNGDDDFSRSIQNLEEDTLYYFRAVIRDDRGNTEYGNRLSFRTAEEVSYDDEPNITTLNATNITESSATLNARWDANNEPVTVWFEWGTSSSVSSETSARYEGTGSGNTSVTLTGLQKGRTYYFRAVARNSEGTVRDGILQFTTDGDDDDDDYYVPDPANDGVFTVLATSIGSTSAQLNGIVRLDDRTSKTAWFEYGTTTALGQRSAERYLGTLEIQSFSASATGLSANTTYYFRAIVRDEDGRLYRGDILSFRTRGAGVAAPAPAPTGADLIELAVSTRDESVCYEESVDYIVTYKNATARTINNTVLRVAIPDEMIFDDATSGVYADDERLLLVTIGALAPGEEKTIFVEGTVSDDAERGDAFIVSAAMEYTNPTTNVREETSAYAFSEVDEDCGTTSLAAFSLFGNSEFLPNTLVEWLFTILIIFGLVFVGRRLYATN